MKKIPVLLIALALSACSTTNSLVKKNDNFAKETKQQSYRIETPNNQQEFEQYFTQQLNKQLAKNKIKNDLTSNDTVITYELDFDQGNRALRYFVGFGAGKAQAIVKAHLINKADGKEIASLTTDARLSMGVFGGDAKATLDNAAVDITKKIVESNIFE
ncbi:DUF4410 domain-containing protein [Acinetobacter beijerinckii]|uniref:DUF4410 domain-containing protein n=1 Tax=Acinetobacter beijerinckii TaxID=262668 RepID=UPI002406A070|nr:DUF4410 domain-containing protein [Acinetobacter beijerinckii]